MKTNILDLLDYLSRTGVEMDALTINKHDLIITLQQYIGVSGNAKGEVAKKGMYLLSSYFDNDSVLMNMADNIYDYHDDDSAKVLYFAISENNDKNTTTMKFIDYLKVVAEIDCELTIGNVDAPYSFVWDKNCGFTEYGMNEFQDILNSEITVYKNGNIKIHYYDDDEQGEYFKAELHRIYRRVRI